MLITEKNLLTSVQGIDEARYGHETAKTTVTISSINVEELLEISSTLRGDEAIIEVSNLVEFNHDEPDLEYALRCVCRFYAKVSYLVDRMKQILTEEK